MNCSQLYLGIDHQVPECNGDLFSVELSPSESSEAVEIRKVLGSRYIYYLAPHTVCGCGWDYLDVGTPSDEDSKASCNFLRTFLASMEKFGQSCKIYSVCIENVGASPESETRLTASEFMDNIINYRVEYSSDVARVFLIGS